MIPLCLSCGGELNVGAPIEAHRLLGECETCHMLHVLKTDEEGNLIMATQDISQKDLTPERKELLEKLRELQTQYNETKATAKAMAKDYRDHLSDLDKEIKDTLDALKEQI
jgi:hypothetical protein